MKSLRRLSRAIRVTAKPLAFCLLALMRLLCAAPAFSQSIHQLYYNNSNWTDTDLSSLTGSAGVGFYSGMAGFVATPNGQFHVYYQDPSNNIHQLYFNGRFWSDENLTKVTRGAVALPSGSGLAGFSIGNFQYVYFVGWNQHVHEYSYVNNWVDTDLTAQSNGALAGAAEQMVAFATIPNSQRHIYFGATDGTVHQLYFNGTRWSDENLTSVTRGATATSPLGMAGCAVGNHQYVFFLSGTHLHMYSYINSWIDEDWTVRSGITGLGGLSGYLTPGTTRFQMYFNDDRGPFDPSHLYQLSYDDANPNAWGITDLTTRTGVDDALALRSVGFATTPNDQLHFYTVAGGSVGQFYFNGTKWDFETLPGITVDYWNGMAGFSVGNLQYVYYVYRPPAQ
jgi:hypothetical protein